MKEVTCNKCGWVHIALPAWELTTQASDIEPRYLKCFRCGNSYKDFRDAKPEDCPVGSTIQAILDKDEAL